MVAPLSSNAPSRASGGSDGVSDQSEKCTHCLFMSPFSTLISTVHEHLRGRLPSPRPPRTTPADCALSAHLSPNQRTVIKPAPLAGRRRKEKPTAERGAFIHTAMSY